MHFFYIFLTISALLPASAIPLPNRSSVATALNPPSTLYRRAIDNGNPTQSTDVPNGGGGSGNNQHVGESTIPPRSQRQSLVVTVSDRVPSSQDGEIISQIQAHHQALRSSRPNSLAVQHGKSILVKKGWHPRDGLIKDSVDYTYHSDNTPGSENKIGRTHRVFRPLTVSIGERVPGQELEHIEAHVRQYHAGLANSDRAKAANVGAVTQGWQPSGIGCVHHEITVGYYKVPDHSMSTNHGRLLDRVTLRVPTAANPA